MTASILFSLYTVLAVLGGTRAAPNRCSRPTSSAIAAAPTISASTTPSALPNSSLVAVQKLSIDSTFLYDLDNTIIQSPEVTSESGVAIDADVYITDLVGVTEEQIKKYHDEGKTVICYFSAGSTDANRRNAANCDPECVCGTGGTLDADNYCIGGDANAKQASWDVYWLNIHLDKCKVQVREQMTARMTMGQEKGCDGVDPDNVDSYMQAKPPHGNTEADETEYLFWLAQTAHNMGMMIGLKNSGNIIRGSSGDAIVEAFDFSLNESCGQFQSATYDECTLYEPFVAAGKPQLRLEYSSSITTCPEPKVGHNMAVYAGKTIDSKQITLNCPGARA